MAVTRTFPSLDALQRFRFRPMDAVVGAGVFLLLYAVVRLGASAHVPFRPRQSAAIDTSPSRLPYYAARSLLRMFVALFFAYAFSLGYAYAAARSRRARLVLIPALDILQSVPVLGFLAVTVTFFLALFPGSELGLEAASVFAVFTSQAWNILARGLPAAAGHGGGQVRPPQVPVPGRQRCCSYAGSSLSAAASALSAASSPNRGVCTCFRSQRLPCPKHQTTYFSLPPTFVRANKVDRPQPDPNRRPQPRPDRAGGFERTQIDRFGAAQNSQPNADA